MGETVYSEFANEAVRREALREKVYARLELVGQSLANVRGSERRDSATVRELEEEQARLEALYERLDQDAEALRDLEADVAAALDAWQPPEVAQ